MKVETIKLNLGDRTFSVPALTQNEGSPESCARTWNRGNIEFINEANTGPIIDKDQVEEHLGLLAEMQVPASSTHAARVLNQQFIGGLAHRFYSGNPKEQAGVARSIRNMVNGLQLDIQQSRRH